MKKKYFIIICINLLVVLAVVSGLFYYQYRIMQQQLRTSRENLTQAETSLADRETYIASQEAYIEELYEQIEELELYVPEESDDKNIDKSYQEEYPDLYAQAEYDKRNNTGRGKIVYLTFDDGPSNLTPQVLDLLDDYNAKATFFVVYNESSEYKKYLSEIVERGHTLALHSYSHDYKKIYASVDAFLADFEKVYNWVYEETGQRPTLFRFPGGSINGDAAITSEIAKEMERRGFIYYDWNVSSGDGSNLTTTEDIIEKVQSTVSRHSFPVVLMHDASGKKATLEALPVVLENLKDMGYSFDRLDETMMPVQY